MTPRPRSAAQLSSVVELPALLFVPALPPRCASTAPASTDATSADDRDSPNHLIEYIERSYRSIRVAAYPQRIVCLTEETTETLYRLGAGDRVVGVSGYTARPPEARQKPKVSAFINARFDKIDALRPDLVLAFSDLQATLAAELIRRGYTVVTFNQRSVAEILQMIRMLGGLVGLADRAEALADELEARPRRHPRVGGPVASAAARVLRGMGRPADLRHSLGRGARRNRRRHAGVPAVARRLAGEGPHRHARCRRAAAPEVILASWCGKKVRRSGLPGGPGGRRCRPSSDGHIYEIKSTYILQPGPAALTEGVRQIHALLCRMTGVPADPAVAPEHSYLTLSKAVSMTRRS